MLDSDDRKSALRAQIERMCDKLGYEVDRLDVILYTSLRGRPRINPDVSDIAGQIKLAKEDPTYWSPEAIERRARAKANESMKNLEEMLKLGGDKNDNEGHGEGHGEATDALGGVGGVDKHPGQ